MKKLILAKTLSWYFFHFIIVTCLGSIITADIGVGLKLASAELLFETVLYFGHEADTSHTRYQSTPLALER